MADTKISNLTALAEAPATGDLLAIVDVSAGATKKLTIANLIDAVEATAVDFTTSVDVDNLKLDGNVLSSTSGAVTVTPLAGQNFNVSLATTGDFVVNTNQLYVDTSTGYVGSGTTPGAPLEVMNSSALQLRLRTTVSAPNYWELGRSPVDGTFRVSSGSLSDVLVISETTGSTLIGTTTDSGGKLQVVQASTTAAIPALRLNQADISEGFVDFIGTSAASAAGPISTWTTATIAGFVRCEINGAAFWMPFYNAPTA